MIRNAGRKKISPQMAMEFASGTHEFVNRVLSDTSYYYITVQQREIKAQGGAATV